ncbi:MAG: substrate-binding periplasmic protein, partial [Pyrinomonadaceae bacterium]
MKRTLEAAARLASTAVCLLFLTPAAPAQEALRWGADPSGGAPYVYADPSHPDTYIGYEVEIADALAKAMGRRAVFVPTDWETIVQALQRGAFDVVLDGLEPTEDRARQILFSKPYYVFNLQLTVRKGETRIGSLEDCRHRVVGTLSNTAASRLMEKQGIPFRGYADPVGAYRDLELGRIDAVLMDVPMEMFYARSNPRLKPAGEPFYKGVYVLGLRKGDEKLKAEVDAAVDKIVNDGSLETILRKWSLWNDAQLELRAASNPNGGAAAGESSGVKFEMTSATFNWRGAILRLTQAAGVTVLIAFGSMFIAL